VNVQDNHRVVFFRPDARPVTKAQNQTQKYRHQSRKIIQTMSAILKYDVSRLKCVHESKHHALSLTS